MLLGKRFTPPKYTKILKQNILFLVFVHVGAHHEERWRALAQSPCPHLFLSSATPWVWDESCNFPLFIHGVLWPSCQRAIILLNLFFTSLCVLGLVRLVHGTGCVVMCPWRIRLQWSSDPIATSSKYYFYYTFLRFTFSAIAWVKHHFVSSVMLRWVGHSKVLSRMVFESFDMEPYSIGVHEQIVAPIKVNAPGILIMGNIHPLKHWAWLGINA